MKPTRRELLQTVAATTGVAALAGCGLPIRKLANRHAPYTEIPTTSDPDLRFLNRIGFGGTVQERAAIAKQGQGGYLNDQLDAVLPEDPALQWQLGRLDVFAIQGVELEYSREELLRQLQAATILRAVYAPNQLKERMVDFWTNHFNIFAPKEHLAWRKPADEWNVIRAHALGKFPDMVRASAKSPAMLAYLDNQVNRSGVPNENYARELMELHTLGVHGGYTQTDVREVARCLTGWTIEDRFLHPRGRVRFDSSKHDNGPKTVLGRRIPGGGGARDLDMVLDILVAHPKTARFISTKLCRYFFGEPADDLVEAVTAVYLKTKGDIREMLRVILTESDGHPSSVVKRPYDFMVSALRHLEASTDGGRPLQQYLDAMGQPLYQWPMPDGYPDRTAAWSGTLLARWNFALRLVDGNIRGTSINWTQLALDKNEPDQVILGQKIQAIRNKNPREAAALCLMTPEFQWR